MKISNQKRIRKLKCDVVSVFRFVFNRSVDEENSYLNKDLERAFLKQSQAQFTQRTEPTLVIPKNVGNMYTATLYSCLASLFLR